MATAVQLQQIHLQAVLTELKTCSLKANLERGKQLHAEAVECGLSSSIYVASALINMYAKCGCLVCARQVFDRTKNPNEVCWNALILGYAENGAALAALDVFTRMNSGGPPPNAITFLAALKACISLSVEGANWGMAIHKLVVENGFDRNVYVQNTLIDMYANCGNIVKARQVFDDTKRPTVVSWNVLIMAYAENGQGEIALELFRKMRNENYAPTSVTFIAALKACIAVVAKEGASVWTECTEWGRTVYNLALEAGCSSDIYLRSTLIDLYAKCSNMVEARDVFDNMHSNVVSWNVLILGYADNGQGLAALKMYMRMRKEGLEPQSITFAGALKACALLGALEYGRKIHKEIVAGNYLNLVLVTCLVDFYAKCGSLVEAQNVFKSNPDSRDIATWTALLASFSSCGDVEPVFELFQKMQEAGIQPNSVTFLSILNCCSHAGLVDKGRECFSLMSSKYEIVPIVKHYNCMVDIYGRGNKLNEAMALLQCMNCRPTYATWRIILGSCRKWKTVEIGKLAFESSIYLDDTDAGVYVVMGQIYKSRGMLKEQEMVMQMKSNIRGLEKQGETCWANEVGEAHLFLVRDLIQGL